MNVTQDMYTKLFNGITDAMGQLEKVVELLSQAQIEAEDVFINQDEQ